MLRCCAKMLLEKRILPCNPYLAQRAFFHTSSQLTTKKDAKSTAPAKKAAVPPSPPSPPPSQPPKTQSSPTYLEINESDGVRELVMNQPCSRNPLSMKMLQALHEGLKKDLNNEKLRAIVISANGPVWSSGYDLKELSGSDKKLVQDIFDKLIEIVLTIQNSPVPVIAKVHGVVQGAALQIISACDIVVSSENATFATPGVNVGVFSSAAGSVLSREMPRHRVLYLLMTGEPMCAHEAYNDGLVSIIVPRCRLDQEVTDLVCVIKSKSRAVIADGKTFFYKQMALSPEDALMCSGQQMANSLSTPDAQEGLRAFKEKRLPKWTHKSK